MILKRILKYRKNKACNHLKLSEKILLALLIEFVFSVFSFAEDLQPLSKRFSEDENSMLKECIKKQGTVKLSGLIQFRFAAQEDDPNGKEKEDSFKIRRARLRADGTLIEDVEYYLEIDATREAALQELEIRFQQFPQASLTVGQLKLPFSLENLTSSKKLDTIELAQVVSALVPDIDIGLKVEGKFIDKRYSYKTAIANGNGRNKKINDNNDFLYILRLEGTPIQHLRVQNKDLTVCVGVNAAFSNDSEARSDEIFGVIKAIGTPSGGERRLAGADLWSKMGRFSFKAEYLQGNFRPAKTGYREINAQGYYFQGGYFISPLIEGLARYEAFDPDKAIVNNSDLTWVTLGLNYFIKGHDLKVQANYILKSEDGNVIKDDALFTMLQLLF